MLIQFSPVRFSQFPCSVAFWFFFSEKTVVTCQHLWDSILFGGFSLPGRGIFRIWTAWKVLSLRWCFADCFFFGVFVIISGVTLTIISWFYLYRHDAKRIKLWLTNSFHIRHKPSLISGPWVFYQYATLTIWQFTEVQEDWHSRLHVVLRNYWH